MNLLADAQEHILRQDDGKRRLYKAVNDLSSAFALAVLHPKAMNIRDDVTRFPSGPCHFGQRRWASSSGRNGTWTMRFGKLFRAP